MTDADNAQFNACAAQLPRAKILMCWFHVCQNVKDRIAKAALAPVTTAMIFRGLNNLHVARTHEEFLSRRSSVLASWRSASTSFASFKAVADHIIAQWILHPRFSCWQAYHTPPGCATTNNPLEQYHKTLKLVIKSSRATPAEMVDRLDKSRLVFIHMRKSFSSTHSVSERLKALHNLTVRRKELRATPLLSAGDLPVHLVQVLHRPRMLYGDEESALAEDPKKTRMPYKSIHVLRMQWQGMPKDGWLVDARLRSCACRFNMKFGICIHVIHSTRELALPCPGMPPLVPVFVSNQQQRSTTTQRSQRTRSAGQRGAHRLQQHEDTDIGVLSAANNDVDALERPVQGPQLRQHIDDTHHQLETFDGLPVHGPQPRAPPVIVAPRTDTSGSISDDHVCTTTANMERFELAPIDSDTGMYETRLLNERDIQNESLSAIYSTHSGPDGYMRSYSDSMLQTHMMHAPTTYGATPVSSQMNRPRSARASLQLATANDDNITALPQSITCNRQSCGQTKRRRC